MYIITEINLFIHPLFNICYNAYHNHILYIIIYIYIYIYIYNTWPDTGIFQEGVQIGAQRAPKIFASQCAPEFLGRKILFEQKMEIEQLFHFLAPGID